MKNIIIAIVLMSLTACSFGVQVGYHGTSSIDDRHYTADDQNTARVKERKY